MHALTNAPALIHLLLIRCGCCALVCSLTDNTRGASDVWVSSDFQTWTVQERVQPGGTGATSYFGYPAMTGEGETHMCLVATLAD